jgi:hypothetical protein
MAMLGSRDDFRWTFVGESLGRALRQSLDANQRDARRVEELQAQVQSLERAQARTDSRVDALAAGHPIVVRTEREEDELEAMRIQIMEMDARFTRTLADLRNSLQVLYDGAVQIPSELQAEGVIRSMTRMFGNPCGRGKLEVTCLEAVDSDLANSPMGIIEFDSDAAFQSADIPDQWVQYDFKDRMVSIVKYSLRSSVRDTGRKEHLKSWVLEVSRDGSDRSWELCDGVLDDRRLDGMGRRATYTVARVCTGRFVRLKQTGVNHEGNRKLCLSGFEIYGTVDPPYEG